MTLSELRTQLTKLPKKLKVDNTYKYLWEVNRWDGPLEGIALYKDEVCYFTLIRETGCGDNRKRWFALLKLTLAQMGEEFYWHTLFREYVGTHNDYGQDGSIKSENTWHKFYDRYKQRTPRDYSNNEVIGWYRD